MIVVVPVSMFAVPYQVARGRPYSRLEQRVLEDVASRKGATLASLCDTFRVHERLMVEAVVTLVGAGWVAVTSGREATFVLTDEGQKACSSGKDPVSVIVLPAAPCILILDRTTGQLARRGEVPTVPPDEARLDLHPCTPERVLRSALDESQIQKLLPRASGEWVRSIGRARLVTFRRYVAVRADLAEQTVVGLPRSWYQALSPQILAVAQLRQDDDDESPVTGSAPDGSVVAQTPTATPAVTPGSGPTGRATPLTVAHRSRPPAAATPAPPPPPRLSHFPWLDEDRPERKDHSSPALATNATLFAVISGAESHERLIVESLSEAARHVLIASPVVALERLARLGDPIRAAVSRGVRVDILYGETNKGTTPADVVKLLDKFGYHAARQQGRDLLRPAKRPTGSGAGLMLFDREDGALEAIIGDYAWCGPGTSDGSRSVHLGGSEFTAQVARAAAGLWAWSGDPGSADRWRRVADQCQDATAMESARGGGVDDPIPAELVVDDEHAGAIHGLRRGDVMYFGSANRQDDVLAAGIRGITVALAVPDVEAAAAQRLTSTRMPNDSAP